MEKATIITLSTSHIMRESEEWLENQYNGNNESDLVVYPKLIKMADGEDCNIGWFIFACQIDDPDWRSNLRLPVSLWDCLRFARQHGCDWLMLDADGPVEDTLPAYDY